ncbi:MAG TPA: hypothetical protein VMM13_19680, partial [Euzebya sp.]|nr:hypothetical protein [Euzebya sp.]
MLIALAVTAMASTAAIGLASPSAVPLVWLGAVLAGAGAASWNAVAMLAIIRGTDHTTAGRVSGIVVLGFYGGFVVGPTLFGALVDAADSYTPGWGLVLVVFCVALGASLSALRSLPAVASRTR